MKLFQFHFELSKFIVHCISIEKSTLKTDANTCLPEFAKCLRIYVLPSSFLVLRLRIKASQANV